MAQSMKPSTGPTQSAFKKPIVPVGTNKRAPMVSRPGKAIMGTLKGGMKKMGMS